MYFLVFNILLYYPSSFYLSRSSFLAISPSPLMGEGWGEGGNGRKIEGV
jgi:hypothetical protein